MGLTLVALGERMRDPVTRISPPESPETDAEEGASSAKAGKDNEVDSTKADTALSVIFE
jgi:hypothetical protein